MIFNFSISTKINAAANSHITTTTSTSKICCLFGFIVTEILSTFPVVARRLMLCFLLMRITDEFECEAIAKRYACRTLRMFQTTEIQIHSALY